jgi:hypothetical protein
MFSNIFSNVAGRIQISSCTSMMLEVVGGYVTEERGTIEVKVTTNKRKSKILMISGFFPLN